MVKVNGTVTIGKDTYLRSFWDTFNYNFTPFQNFFNIRFCGWVDVGLSEDGQIGAEKAAKAIYDSGIGVTKIYTSMLKRAHLTIDTILTKIDLCEHNIHKDWRLNERHYGALTGLNKGTSTSYYDLPYWIQLSNSMLTLLPQCWEQRTLSISF